ncbi:DUF2797 domain-containing protein, partial [Francisella tularensis]
TNNKSFKIDKDRLIYAKRSGIKEQYINFDSGLINIRKLSGYKCMLSALN